MKSKKAGFEETFLPHLDAAYNLARWIARDPADAEDVVQEAFLRAYKFYDSFHGGDGRAWLLKIVRNTCFTWLQKNRTKEIACEFDEEIHEPPTESVETMMINKLDVGFVKRIVNELPPLYREMIVLRDIEELSYKEISSVTELPLGTVMSRLARARTKLQAEANFAMGGAAK